MAQENDEFHDCFTDYNHDDLIMEQEKEIEKEIASKYPLVSKLLNVGDLSKDYSPNDEVYQQKVQDLEKHYKSIRKTRPDGNCFFRAFAFSYFESLIQDKTEYDRVFEIAERSLSDLVKLGFPQFTMEDFNETFISILKKTQEEMTTEKLLEIFNDSGPSDYIVVYLRLITSGQLLKENDFFSNFIEGGRTVQEFCRQEVEPMYKESDHIHIIALTSALNVNVRIIYMDRGEGGKVNMHDFGPDQNNSSPRIHLLYRPGHYDILYNDNL